MKRFLFFGTIRKKAEKSRKICVAIGEQFWYDKHNTTLITCFVLQFMGVWNDFLTPLYMSSTSKLFPMTMSVYQFFGRNGSYWNYVFADIVLTIVPVLVVYGIGQRYIIGGATAGAVKG